MEAKSLGSSRQTDYAEVRARVTRSFPEKANEVASTISALQDLTRATLDMTERISLHCAH